MSSKAAIFSRLRKALDVSGSDAERAATISQRMAEALPGVVPLRAQLPDEPRVELFVTLLQKGNASVTRLDSLDDLPGEVSHYLRNHNLPASIRMGQDPLLGAAPWRNEPTLEVTSGASDGQDLACLSHAFSAVAETGTLVLASGQDNPTTLNFLPEHHIVVARASDVKASMEEAFADLRGLYGKGIMPRAVNMISGPSRSADIEQTILLGAHGPRALHVVVIDG